MGATIITPDQGADLVDGFWYVNIHTADVPSGEIRGQLDCGDGGGGPGGDDDDGGWGSPADDDDDGGGGSGSGGGDDDDDGGAGSMGDDDDDAMPLSWGDDDDDGDGIQGGLFVVDFDASDACGGAGTDAVLDIGCATIPVARGQVVRLHCIGEAGDDDDDDDGSLRADPRRGRGRPSSVDPDDPSLGPGAVMSDDDDDGPCFHDWDEDDDDGGSGDHCCFDTVDGILTVYAEEISLVVVGTDECGNEGLCEIDLCGPASATLALAPRDRTTCAADLDGNGLVDADDLMLLLADWGRRRSIRPVDTDLDGDGVVDDADVLVLLADWGGC